MDRKPPELTPRQLAVLAGIANGDLGRVIAARLGIAERTVGKAAHEALIRLGASCREHAVFLATTRGLIVTGPDGRAVPALIADAPTDDPDLLDFHAVLTTGRTIRGRSSRKTAVVQLTEAGHHPKLIARRLRCSVRTVYRHQADAYHERQGKAA